MKYASFSGPVARAQYVAVLRMRRQMLLHSLRGGRGRFELGARIFWLLILGFVCLGVGSTCAVIAGMLAVDGQLQLMPLLLWPVLLMWQVIPVMLATAQENIEFSFLLRFPVSFRSYLLLYLCLGIFDPASLLGGSALLGIWIGVVSAMPSRAFLLALILAAYGLFNFLLTRAIFAWIERWLAQRRAREFLGMAFLALFLGFQLINPAWHRTGHVSSRSRAKVAHAARTVKALQGPLPPGLAGQYIEFAARGQDARAAAAMGGMVLYIGGAALLLGLRLRAEYRGESLGDAPQAVEPRKLAASGTARYGPGDRGYWLDVFAGAAVGAVLAKELHYLSRSGVVLFGLIAPLAVLFAAGGGLNAQHYPAMQYAFPLAVGYSFLPLTRQVCNSLGAEGAGIQLYFLAPTSFRAIIVAKNMMQVALFLVELVLVGLIVLAKYGRPSPSLAFATFCWLCFALPANLAAGNILSISMAYKMTVSRLSREQGSVGNGLLSLLVQLLIFTVGVAVYLPLMLMGHGDFAPWVLLLLAAGAVWVWLRVLDNIDGMTARRRESLIAAVARTS